MFAHTILILTLIVLILRYPVSLILWAIRASKLTANIPGPKPTLILGNAPYFANTKNLTDGAEKLLNLFKLYFHPTDKIMKFWLGPKMVVAVANPQYIETILLSEHSMTKDLLYTHTRIFSDGVFAANGVKWAELRKMANPFLTRKALEPNLDIFHEKAMKLLKVLDNKVENYEQFNIKPLIGKCAVDMMLVSNYGCDINEIENDDRPKPLDGLLEESVDQLFKLCVEFPTCLSVGYSTMTTEGKEILKNAKIYWNLMGGILKSRKQQRDHKNGNKILYADRMIKKAETDKLSWEKLGKLTSDFVLAGSHSVSLMTSTIILLLAMYPEHQEAVYQEQLEILGDDPEVAPTWEQLSKMIYLTRVFKEVIRHFTAPVIMRQVTQDIDLGKFKIPEGSSALISFYTLHRDPTVWSHPLEFYPDHFLPEESSKRPKNSYLPFSWGPRNCPGGLYAMTAVKVLVSTLVRKFFFKTDLKFEEISYKYSLFMDINQGQVVKKIPRVL